jgi:hypothetical protein
MLRAAWHPVHCIDFTVAVAVGVVLGGEGQYSAQCRTDGTLGTQPPGNPGTSPMTWPPEESSVCSLPP